MLRRKINWFFLFNEKGEVAGDAGKQVEGAKSGEGAAEAKFSQAEVDRIVQDRLNRDRQKYSDYEDLKKKASDYEKQQEHMTQLEMEKKQEYEKLKEGWSAKENEYKTLLDKTRAEVQSERVSNTLNQEILKKNAYPEAAQLLKSMTKYNEDGSITIRGKDANGIETDLSVDKGVEQFLKDRPYLVKGSGQGGGGTAGSAGQGASGSVSVNLGQELQHAMAVGDRKTINELKMKIKAKHAGSTMVI